MFCFCKQCQRWDDTTNKTVYTVSHRAVNETNEHRYQVTEMELDWVWVWLTNCLSSLVCYFVARSAAKMRIQPLAYALPLFLSTPLMFGLIIGGCELSNSDPCAFVTSELAGYLRLKCFGVNELEEVWMKQLWFLMPIWWFSQLWITWHIWSPKSERLAKSEK